MPKKNLILCDSNIVMGDSLTDLSSRFPCGKNKLCIVEPTVLECAKNEIENKGLRRRAFEKLKKFEPLIPPGKIFAREIEYYSNHKKSNKNLNIKSKQKWVNNYKRGLKNNNSSAYKNITERLAKQNAALDEFWEKIETINSDELLDISLNDVEEFIRKNNFQICQDTGHTLNSILDELASTDKLSETHPSCDILVKVLALIELLKKPQNSTKQFTVSLGGVRTVVTKSLITDMKIYSSYLPYISQFVTKDKNLIKVIKFLHQSYSNKITGQ